MKKLIKAVVGLTLLTSPVAYYNVTPAHAEEAAASNVISSVKVNTSAGSYDALIIRNIVAIVIPKSLNDNVMINEVKITSDTARSVSAPSLFPNKSLSFTQGTSIPNLNSITLRSYLGIGQSNTGIPLQAVRKSVGKFLVFNSSATLTNNRDVPLKIVIVNGKLTRLDAAKLLADVIGVKPLEGAVTRSTYPFKDSEGLTGTEMGIVDVLYRKGIIQGYLDNTFKPNEILTQSDLTKLIEQVSALK